MPFWEDGATFILWAGSPWQNILFPQRQKAFKVCLFIFTFIALVHLPVFTKSSIWDAFSKIKYYHLCGHVFVFVLQKITFKIKVLKGIESSSTGAGRWRWS